MEPLPNPADEIVAGVDAFYDGVRTFKATFKQRYVVLKYDVTKDSTGSVSFEKPNKMSWRYRNGNRAVSDGQLVKIYELANRQMYEIPLAKTQYPLALSFLMGEAGLERVFKLSKLDSARLNFARGHTILAEPLSATTAYERLVFYIDATSYQVRRVLVMDAQGNRNRFDFSEAQVNPAIAAGEFEFTPPPGTQVIRP